MRIRGLSPSTLADLFVRSLRRNRQIRGCRVFFCVADHYEPMVGNAPAHVQFERVERWAKEYPKSVAGIEDSRGSRPQHTFFYPIEQRTYDPRLVEKVARMCRDRDGVLGAIEFHLHHGPGVEEVCLTSEQLRKLIEQRKREFIDLGSLAVDEAGLVTYGFVHGNWALDNAHPSGRYCGLNDELTILRETGCYADFTMPSAPAHGQTRTINSIYYAVDDPSKPKSHNVGIPVAVGKRPPKDSLLLIQGPLCFDWSRRKAGFLPGLENGELHGSFAPTPKRFQLWLNAGVCIQGQPNWIFIKLHTHGALERNAQMLLGQPMRQFHEELARVSRTSEDFRYFYVSAREMANLVRQAEAGAREPAFT